MGNRVKIVSDGTSGQTRIYDSEGNEIKWGESGVLSISIGIGGDENWTVTLELDYVDMEVNHDNELPLTKIRN